MNPLSSVRIMRRRGRCRGRVALLFGLPGVIALAGAATTATAAPENEPAGVSELLGERRVVAGIAAPGALPDVRLGIAWLREDRRASLARERSDQSTGGEVGRAEDLRYRQIRQVIQLGAEVGLVHDLSLFVEAPLVLADDRWLHFAGGVNAGNSSLLRDGILPGAGAQRWGLDAANDRPFEGPSDSVFRGPTRRGLEYLAIGLQYAIMNQRRDPSRPTWVVRVEPRLALGKEMAFDPARPEGNRSVNPGFHQLVLTSFFAHRTGRGLAHVGGSWTIPKARSGGAYDRFPLGHQGFGGPQHRVGMEAGFSYEAFVRPQAGHRLLLEVGGLAELRFFGLARGPLWEPLSGSSMCGGAPAACRPEVDVDLDGDGRGEPYPGLVRSPGYGTFGGRVAMALELAARVRMTAGFMMTAEQDHFMSDGRSGVESFDRPGRRFRVEEGRGWQLRVDVTTGF